MLFTVRAPASGPHWLLRHPDAPRQVESEGARTAACTSTNERCQPPTLLHLRSSIASCGFCAGLLSLRIASSVVFVVTAARRRHPQPLVENTSFPRPRPRPRPRSRLHGRIQLPCCAGSTACSPTATATCGSHKVGNAVGAAKAAHAASVEARGVQPVSAPSNSRPALARSDARLL